MQSAKNKNRQSQIRSIIHAKSMQKQAMKRAKWTCLRPFDIASRSGIVAR